MGLHGWDARTTEVKIMKVPVPLKIDPIASALFDAGQELVEATDIFKRSPIPEDFDACLIAMRVMKHTIEVAERTWGVNV